MRCIEIFQKQDLYMDLLPININMRCIEMTSDEIKRGIREGLTLTWDVLKYTTIFMFMFYLRGLTLTWDVLKCI